MVQDVQQTFNQALAFKERGQFLEAASCFRSAADLNHCHSMVELGILYQHGKGVPLDIQESLHWFRKAAHLGNSRAEMLIGQSYEDGIGVRPNISQAIKHYQNASKKGHVEATFKIGCLHFHGKGVPKQTCTAIVELVHAADRGHTEAKYMIGEAYSLLAQQNPMFFPTALWWYYKATEDEHPEAQYRLGCFAEVGIANILRPNPVMAIHWYRKAASNGLMTAHSSLGRCYSLGFGVDKDYGKSLIHYVIAMENGGAKDNKIRSEYEGVRQAYLRTADLKQDDTLLSIGDRLFDGFNVKKSHEDALEWYTIAAEANNGKGQLKLGNMYLFGFGTMINYQLALYWFEKSLRNGVPEAQEFINTTKLRIEVEEQEAASLSTMRTFRGTAQTASNTQILDDRLITSRHVGANSSQAFVDPTEGTDDPTTNRSFTFHSPNSYEDEDV